MTSILTAWIKGVLLGWMIAAPFGPINIEIIRRHLGGGMAAGLLLGLGACSVDTAYILLISFGLITARPGPALQAIMLAASAAILLLLGGMILRAASASARRAASADVAEASGRAWRHYVVGVTMTAASPMNLGFWFAVVATGRGVIATAWGPWPGVVGVMCGTASWVFGLNLALVAGRRLLRPRLLTAINVLGGLLLIGLAGWAMWQFASIIKS